MTIWYPKEKVKVGHSKNEGCTVFEPSLSASSEWSVTLGGGSCPTYTIASLFPGSSMLLCHITFLYYKKHVNKTHIHTLTTKKWVSKITKTLIRILKINFNTSKYKMKANIQISFTKIQRHCIKESMLVLGTNQTKVGSLENFQ